MKPTSLTKSHKLSNNICGDNVENETLYWKCMEYGNIYPSSLIVLNKNTFELQVGAVLNGMDAWSLYCDGFSVFNENAVNCPIYSGLDGDLSALSSYYDNDTNKIYAAGLSKTGMFYVYDIENNELKISKKLVHGVLMVEVYGHLQLIQNQ